MNCSLIRVETWFIILFTCEGPNVLWKHNIINTFKGIPVGQAWWYTSIVLATPKDYDRGIAVWGLGKNLVRLYLNKQARYGGTCL
jgi:hypothetical protein